MAASQDSPLSLFVLLHHIFTIVGNIRKLLAKLPEALCESTEVSWRRTWPIAAGEGEDRGQALVRDSTNEKAALPNPSKFNHFKSKKTKMGSLGQIRRKWALLPWGCQPRKQMGQTSTDACLNNEGNQLCCSCHHRKEGEVK